MTVGILSFFPDYTPSMIGVYKQILDFNGIKHIDLDIDAPGFWDDVKEADVFLAKFVNTDDSLALMRQILPVISLYMKKKCFPNYPTAWHYDDKVSQYYLLKQGGFPVIESWVFRNKRKALRWASDCQYPIVFKLKGGAGSTNVKLIKDHSTCARLIRKAFASGIHPYYFDLLGKMKAFNYNGRKILKFLLLPYLRRIRRGGSGFQNYYRHKNYIYFQKFMPGNEYDTRVTILGDRAFAFRRYVRSKDFRASGSNHYGMNRDKIDRRMVRIAFDVSKTFGFQSMAYDFVYNESKEPCIIEISYTYGDYPEFSTGYWDTELVWHDGHYLPEFFELMDLLQDPNLRLPEINISSTYMHARITD